MKSNVGGLDKILRIVAGLGLIGATAAGMLPVWGYIGIIPLVTGLMGWCPLYPILGLSTCPIKK
jgi:glyoxylate carboligase